MSQEPAEHVVEFGTEDEPRRMPMAAWLGGRGWGPGGRGWGPGGRGLGLDRRVLLGIAGAGAVLLFLSMVQSWQVSSLRDADDIEIDRIDSRLAGLGAWGAGYLVGVLGLGLLATIVLFGPAANRRLARLAALGWAGVLGGIILALFVALGQGSESIAFNLIGQNTPDVDNTHGPGPFLALAGLAAVAFALYQVDRGWPGQELLDDYDEEYPDEEPDTTDDLTDVPAPRRRPSGPTAVAGPAPAPSTGPVDLTVSPTTPFMNLPDPYRDR